MSEPRSEDRLVVHAEYLDRIGRRTLADALRDTLYQLARYETALHRIVEEGRTLPLSRGEMFNIARDALHMDEM